MNNFNGGGLLGRLTALALILGAAYGVRAIAAGGMGCPLGTGSCCVTEGKAAPAAASPAKDAAGSDDEAALERKAPVAPAKAD